MVAAIMNCSFNSYKQSLKKFNPSYKEITNHFLAYVDVVNRRDSLILLTDAKKQLKNDLFYARIATVFYKGINVFLCCFGKELRSEEEKINESLQRVLDRLKG